MGYHKGIDLDLKRYFEEYISTDKSISEIVNPLNVSNHYFRYMFCAWCMEAKQKKLLGYKRPATAEGFKKALEPHFKKKGL
jgi:predicted DNA-binding protein YlxM (UPF0122 family)